MKMLSRNQAKEIVASNGDLSDCDLSGTNLSELDLSAVQLIRSNLSRADISNAVLIRTDLSGSEPGRFKPHRGCA